MVILRVNPVTYLISLPHQLQATKCAYGVASKRLKYDQELVIFYSPIRNCSLTEEHGPHFVSYRFSPPDLNNHYNGNV